MTLVNIERNGLKALPAAVGSSDMPVGEECRRHARIGPCFVDHLTCER